MKTTVLEDNAFTAGGKEHDIRRVDDEGVSGSLYYYYNTKTFEQMSAGCVSTAPPKPRRVESHSGVPSQLPEGQDGHEETEKLIY